MLLICTDQPSAYLCENISCEQHAGFPAGYFKYQGGTIADVFGGIGKGVAVTVEKLKFQSGKTEAVTSSFPVDFGGAAH